MIDYIKLFDDIKQLLYKISKVIKPNIALDEHHILLLSYDIYLTAVGFRNGTFLDSLGYYDNKIIDYLSSLHTIHKNLNFFIGNLYDNYSQVIYIYNIKKEKQIKKYISFLIDPNLYKLYGSQSNKRQHKIAYLLSYDKVNYQKGKTNIYESKDSMCVDYIIKYDNLPIFDFFTYKKNLHKCLHRLKLLNQFLKPLHKSVYLNKHFNCA